MQEIRRLSSRARITSTSFINSYSWGDFKGNPRALMEKYFDAFLYLANWGTHWFMLRLPRRLLDPEIVAQYVEEVNPASRAEPATAAATGAFFAAAMCLFSWGPQFWGPLPS